MFMLLLTSRRSLRSLLIVLLLMLVIACAAKGPRNQARVGALAAGDAALGISQVESQAFASALYDKATHDKLDTAILKVLYATRGYERAVAAVPEGATPGAAVDAARAAVLAGLADLEQALPAVAVVRDPFLRAIAAVKAALASPSADNDGPRPLQSGLPLSPTALLQLMQVIVVLVETGRSSFEKIRAALKKEGATDDELATMDAALTDEINRRESERAGGGA